MDRVVKSASSIISYCSLHTVNISVGIPENWSHSKKITVTLAISKLAPEITVAKKRKNLKMVESHEIIEIKDQR